MTGARLARFRFMLIMLSLLLMQWSIISCQNQEPAKKTIDPARIKEPLIEANKEAVLTEKEQIDDFLDRHQWKMESTGSGLRYMIYHHGDGPVVENGDVVQLKYITSLLNGDTVYSSKINGDMAFRVGNATVISGLEEGILLLRQGDRAKFIIPSHLAYGLIGDQNNVGSKTTLVYDIDLVKIHKNINNLSN